MINIANYIADSAAAAAREWRLTATMLVERDHSRAAELLGIIADRGQISTAALCDALGITSRQVWGMLKHHRQVGRVEYTDRRWWWSSNRDNILTAIAQANQQSHIDAAVGYLTSQGWTCVPPSNACPS